MLTICINFFYQIALLVFYTVAIVKLYRATSKSLKMLAINENAIVEADMVPQFGPAVWLKRRIIRVNLLISLCYCIAIFWGLLV